jgi:hypothetical protein
LQQRLVKTGGRLVKHVRYYWLLLAEEHLNRQRFRAVLGRIALLPIPAGWRMLVKFVSESFYGGWSWGKRRYCQSGSEQGAICAVWVRIADQIGALHMKILSRYASRAKTGV